MPVRRRARKGAVAGQLDMCAALLGAETPPPSVGLKEQSAGDSTAEAVLPLPRSAYKTSVPIYTVKLEQTGKLPLPGSERPMIRSPRDAANVLQQYLAGADREHFVLLFLNTKGAVVGITTVSIGDLASAIVHPREVFKAAILANAASIVLAHNHPSGDPTPSPEDAAVTRRLCEVGELLGIEVLDHIVVGDPGRFVSLKEKGLCP